MTNEQCKALIMGMLEAFGTGQARAHKAQYVDEIMEKAGVNEAPGFIVSRDEHGEVQDIQPLPFTTEEGELRPADAIRAMGLLAIRVDELEERIGRLGEPVRG